jgi:menaquinol-cytochrome c reductase iron-sulfur subunit
MPAEDSSSNRRGFLKAITVAAGGIIGAVLAIPAIRFALFPARRRIVEDARGFVAVGDASAVGDKPVRVEIVSPEQRDAWSRRENVALGAAWLFRDGGGQIRAFTTTCPHLGCAVDFDARSDTFRCPCHTSAFARSGDRMDGPAKRGLDPLETQVDSEGRVSVRFRRFKLDVPEREEA